MPAITKTFFEESIRNNIKKLMKKNIKGIIISNLSQLSLVKDLEIPKIANYTLNITNEYSVEEIKKMGFDKFIISPELDEETIKQLNGNIQKEGIVYGRCLLMTSEYCPVGIFKNCPKICTKGNYKLKDRLNFEFPIYTNRINCNSMIYNSKITSISYANLNLDSIRIDILEEDIDKINEIIEIHKRGGRLEGKEYTNGNLNKCI